MRPDSASYLVLVLGLVGVGLSLILAASPLVRAQSNHSKLDLGFLKEEPYSKKKRASDLSTIKTEADLSVVKDAINPIMKFLYGISQMRLSSDRLREMTTTDGYGRLRLPPKLDDLNRYGARYTRNWRVVDPHTIVFTAEFYGILESSAPYIDTFVFVKTGDQWAFDRHE